MSAHAENHDTHAAPAAAHGHAPEAHAPHGAEGSGYFSHLIDGAFDGLKQGIVGAARTAVSAIYDPLAAKGHGLDHSVLPPVVSILANTVLRPFTAAGRLIHSQGHWFNPGKAWNELVAMVETPFHDAATFVSRGVTAATGTLSSLAQGGGKILNSLSGAPSSTAAHLGPIPLHYGWHCPSAGAAHPAGH